MGISSSHLDENFEPIDIVLSFKEMTVAHTGVNIGENFMETVN